ncbi:unnamed protein product [Clonostachys byssicola]|uniref:Uncharacterized protein n=1 Tax=Clonostachys byssicola TaxID=160290 RepID=A0A9N9U460_9HYPO|nr:unnamed protein product [Clonostachys byssicola]
MISSTLVNALSLLLIGAHHVRARTVRIGSSVKADTEFTVTVDTDGLNEWGGSDRWSKFTVYLALELPDKKKTTSEACVLANSTDLGSLSGTKSAKVKIPADAAPDGANVMASVLIYESDPYGNLTSGTRFSNTATFQGGKAKWAEYETSGSGIFLPERIPCTSYACVRECGVRHFTDEDVKKINSLADWKTMYECMASCSGTTFDPWSVWLAQYGTVNDTDSASTTSAASASATASTTISISQTDSSASASASSTSTDTGAAGQLLAGNFGLVVAVMLAGLAMF